MSIRLGLCCGNVVTPSATSTATSGRPDRARPLGSPAADRRARGGHGLAALAPGAAPPHPGPHRDRVTPTTAGPPDASVVGFGILPQGDLRIGRAVRRHPTRTRLARPAPAPVHLLWPLDQHAAATCWSPRPGRARGTWVAGLEPVPSCSVSEVSPMAATLVIEADVVRAGQPDIVVTGQSRVAVTSGRVTRVRVPAGAARALPQALAVRRPPTGPVLDRAPGTPPCSRTSRSPKRYVTRFSAALPRSTSSSRGPNRIHRRRPSPGAARGRPGAADRRRSRPTPHGWSETSVPNNLEAEPPQVSVLACCCGRCARTTVIQRHDPLRLAAGPALPGRVCPRPGGSGGDGPASRPCHRCREG